MTTISTGRYNVGGVALDRPFKIRRLGHFGFNFSDLDAARRFYVDLLGFRISDQSSNGGFFTRHGSDHHAFVVFPKRPAPVAGTPAAAHYRPDNDINQITWQVQSLQEVVDATHYFRSLEADIRMEGRAGGPGSNWHLYVYDPDEQVDELYYGIEQIGWDGHAKPAEMRHGYQVAPTGPHAAEYDEVQADLAGGSDIRTGYRYLDPLPATHNVDGILLPRPFKVLRIGPVKLFAEDVERTVHYYREVMGFDLTEEVSWRGETASFLRCNTEHHSLAIFPKAWRTALGLSPATTSVSFGMQLANYRQLRDAIAFLRSEGVRVETGVIPRELHPGIDYAAYAFDPDGHCIELYCAMEQLGWDGRPRPAHLRPRVDPHQWPEMLEATSDIYHGEPFLGPWA